MATNERAENGEMCPGCRTEGSLFRADGGRYSCFDCGRLFEGEPGDLSEVSLGDAYEEYSR